MNKKFLFLFFFSCFLIVSCKDEVCCEKIVENETFLELGHDKPYINGSVYYGRNKYIEYYPGNLPIILSVPHGGNLMPNEIKDRTYGTKVNDTNTKGLSIAIMDILNLNFGSRPYVIINNLDRKKIDANRDSIEGVQKNIYAKRAWEEYHYYIEYSKNKIIQDFNYGLFLDIHGHGINPDGFYDLRSWLGYLLKGDELDKPDYELNNISYQKKSSINTLVTISSEDFVQVLRGVNSFGSMLDSLGYKTLPSINDLSPEGMRYFSGGYNTNFHGSSENGGQISSIQIETPYPGIRDNNFNWNKFGEALSVVLQRYFKLHYDIDL
jgi:hypothetical protein|tara:strand:- start:217 stop:1185 length:969 start_codon:yes stop_codon:yes gene_type:complete